MPGDLPPVEEAAVMSDDDGLLCCEEWCDPSERSDDGGHGEVCPERPMEITKGDFVRACEAAAEHAIDAYLIEHEHGFFGDERENAVAEVREAAICRAGIGSCGRGWCLHA